MAYERPPLEHGAAPAAQPRGAKPRADGAQARRGARGDPSLKRILLLTVAAALATCCGSSSHSAKTTTAHRINPNCASHPVTTAQKRAYRRLLPILAQMKRAMTHDAESKLTDRFLLAEETSGLSAYVRN